MIGLTDKGQRRIVELILAGSLWALAAQADEATRYFDIEAQPLAQALVSYGEQADLSVIFSEDVALDRSTSGVTGTYTRQGALEKLLAGTGLDWAWVGDSAVAVTAVPADAPEAQPSGPAAQDRVASIEELVVTARKREERLQNIPIAVSAFPGEELEARGVVDLDDLQLVAPSLVSNGFTHGTGTVDLRVRGMGTPSVNAGLEGSVGLFIDGVYLPRPGLAYVDLLDVARVEVMRGPQGTLFGKNTSAGAVHVISKRPQLDWGGTVTTTLGDFDARRSTLSITGPILGEELAFRLSGLLHRRDGYLDDIRTSDEFWHRDRWAARAQLLWMPTDRLEVLIAYDRAEIDESCCAAVWRQVGPTGAALRALGATVPDEIDPDSLDVGTSFDPFEDDQEQGVRIEARWQLGFGTLTSLSAWRKYEGFEGLDGDYTEADLFRKASEFDEEMENLTSELRLAGSTHSLDWMVATYGYVEEMELAKETRFGTQLGEFVSLNAGADVSLFPPGAGASSRFDQKARGWALFTHATWHFTERLSTSVGFRWAYEKKEGEGIINGAAPGTVVNQPFCDRLPFGEIVLCDNFSWRRSRSEREWSGGVSVGYQMTDEVNGYVSYSRGHKAGGFNLDWRAASPVTGDQIEIDPEYADAWEVGVKAQLWDGRLTVHSAIFHTRFDDLQLFSVTSGGGVVSNVGEATTRGVEMESWLALTTGVNLVAGVTYLSARYGDHLDGSPLEGRRLPAPRWQGSAAVSVERPLPGTRWNGFLTAGASYHGEKTRTLEPIAELSGFWLVNGRLGLRSPDGQWELSLWAENLTDERYDKAVIEPVAQPGSLKALPGAPRMWGVTLAYRF